jgi:hypothetical protein
MSQYQPRHTAPARYRIPPPPAGPLPPGRPPRPSLPRPSSRKGWAGLVAAGVALLAFVALIIVVSLPHSTPSQSASRHASSASRPAPTSARSPRAGRPATKGIRTSARHGRAASGKAAKAKSAPTKPRSLTKPTGRANRARTGTRSAVGASKPAPTPTAPAFPAGAASSPAVNTPAPTGFGPLLRRAWVSADPGRAGLTAADVQSTLPGSVYYAVQPAVAVHWAISQFVPSELALSRAGTKAGQAVLAQFHKVWIFEQLQGHSWRYAGSFSPGSCPTGIPAPVLSAWGLCQVGS